MGLSDLTTETPKYAETHKLQNMIVVRCCVKRKTNLLQTVQTYRQMCQIAARRILAHGALLFHRLQPWLVLSGLRVPA